MRILVIGGYGNFGKRLVKSLLEYTDHEIIIGGRSIDKANKVASELYVEFGKTVETVCIDVLARDLSELIMAQSPELVVNASGPYHFQSSKNTDQKEAASTENYQVARTCLIVKCHYIDLADHRNFVVNFSASLNKAAIEKGLVFVTGASTVPALTDAVIQHYSPQFSELTSINYGISPGNKTERGKGTIGSILSYTGKPFHTLKNGKLQSIFGWQDLSRYDFGDPIGKRWMSNCNIPDLSLLPSQYPSLKSVKFQAGLEVSILHLGLWFLSLFSRIGIIENWSRYSNPLTIMSEWFSSLGSNCGGMYIKLAGISLKKGAKKINWQLVAEDGVGPNIPTISAEIIIRKLAENKLSPGARPCMGLFNLSDFLKIADRWGIYQKEQNNEQ